VTDDPTVHAAATKELSSYHQINSRKSFSNSQQSLLTFNHSYNMQMKGRVIQLTPGSRRLDVTPRSESKATRSSSTTNTNTSQQQRQQQQQQEKEAVMNEVAESLSFPESVMSNDENHEFGNLGGNGNISSSITLPPASYEMTNHAPTSSGVGMVLLGSSTNKNNDQTTATTTTTTNRNKFGTGTAPSKATAVRAQDSRLPAVKSTSVFDRLYKSHTVSSRSHTKASKAMIVGPSSRSKGRGSTITSVDVDKDLQIFGRLSVGGGGGETGVGTTSASRNPTRRGNNTPHKIKYSIGAASFASPPPTNPKRSPASYQTPKTAVSGFGSAGSTGRTRTTRYEFSPRMKPLTKVYFISKFHPGMGLEPVEPLSLGYTFFQSFCEYESGGMDPEQIAKEIIVALFKKDFPSGRHWALHEPELGTKVKGGAQGGTAYPVSMSATYDWEDAYRVAHCRGVVRFKRAQKEIRVENYTYDLTGDP
jgi:hypothetical protein